MVTALIDSDTPIWSTAFVSEEVSESIAKSRLDVCIQNIIDASGCSEYMLFVSGGNNFRKEIDSSYKANRTMPDPKHRETLRLHLINEWKAVECVGFEADDSCGVHQTDNTIICGIDKDLLQIPGRHYQWPIIRKGTIAREGMFHEISVEQGWRNLFTQALTGDTSDNIKGVAGIGPKKAEKLLAEYKTEEEMYKVCLEQYVNREALEDAALNFDDAYQRAQERFDRNLNLLYIWRELGITYSIRKEIYGRFCTGT